MRAKVAGVIRAKCAPSRPCHHARPPRELRRPAHRTRHRHQPDRRPHPYRHHPTVPVLRHHHRHLRPPTRTALVVVTRGACATSIAPRVGPSLKRARRSSTRMFNGRVHHLRAQAQSELTTMPGVVPRLNVPRPVNSPHSAPPAYVRSRQRCSTSRDRLLAVRVGAPDARRSARTLRRATASTAS